MSLSDLFKNAEQLQQTMMGTQKEIEGLRATGEAGAGMVVIVVDGTNTPQSVKIDPSLMMSAVNVVEDLVLSAFKDAMVKIEKLRTDKLVNLASQIELPADFNIPGFGNDFKA
ncbi:MAG: YbaB/EbfC family nucleoid-associated protein [Pseudomonadota bacterium]